MTGHDLMQSSDLPYTSLWNAAPSPTLSEELGDLFRPESLDQKNKSESKDPVPRTKQKKHKSKARSTRRGNTIDSDEVKNASPGAI